MANLLQDKVAIVTGSGRGIGRGMKAGKEAIFGAIAALEYRIDEDPAAWTAEQDRKVAVITGDGELLMGIGALVTIASVQPQNLTVVCQDNSLHGETGGQKGHTAETANLEAIAQGAGIASTMTISEPGQITNAAAFIAEAPGPRFLLTRILPTPPCDFKRDLDMAACRVRFRQNFLASI